MISEGYAWEYDGGTKKKDFDSLLAKRAKSWYNISRRQTLNPLTERETWRSIIN
jgi:hypothetical protein